MGYFGAQVLASVAPSQEKRKMRGRGRLSNKSCDVRVDYYTMASPPPEGWREGRGHERKLKQVKGLI